MKFLAVIPLVFLFTACASKAPTSGDAQKALEERYAAKVGTATKSDFVQEYGNAEWCRDNEGLGETCRFRRNLGVQWMGTETDRTHYDTYDEVIATFNSNGILTNTVVKSQR